MLAREIPKKTGQQVKLSYGSIVSPNEVERLVKKKNIMQLNARCYAAAESSRSEEQAEAANTEPAEVSTVSKDQGLLAEVDMLREDDALWSDEKTSLFMFRGDRAPSLLNEIGRGRAVTFAAIGAGAGNEIDLSPEDEYYHHLVLWSHESNSLIGAYRIGFVNEVVKAHGVKGLYLDHVFDIDPGFYAVSYTHLTLPTTSRV